MDAPHPMSPFVPMLKDLAEGRVEREQWLAWWEEHAAAIERAAKPGWFLGLKPRQLDQLPSAAMVQSQSGAGYILKQLGIPYEPSLRYADAWKAEFEAYQKEEQRREKEKAKRLAPGVASVTAAFPKFGAFLKRRAKDLVEQIDPPAGEEQIAALRETAGGALPAAYERLLRCTAGVWVGALDLRTHHLFVVKDEPGVVSPAHGMLCFGAFSLEADGDQVLFDPATLADDDPPVLYYAHAIPAVRQLAPSFTAWLESLPKSPAFR